MPDASPIRRLALVLALLAPLGGATAGEAPPAAAAAQAATLTIRVPGSDGETAAVGAWFLEAASGLVVTNAHVVVGLAVVEVGAVDGRTARAVVVARDPVRDIAILRADLPGLPALSFAGEAPAVGATVYAVGSPFGLGQTVTRGIVSALDRAIDATTPFGMIQHDAPLNPGSSGGPVIDETGAVIGINTAMPDGFRRDVGIAYAIPAAIAAETVARLVAEGDPPARRIGASFRALTPRLAEATGLAPGAGVLVEAVEAGGVAAEAGLAPADLVVAIGAMTVGELRDIAVAIDRANPRASLDVFAIRGTERIVITLPPAGPPEPAPVPPPRPSKSRPWVGAAELGLTLAGAGPARVAAVADGSPAAAAGVGAGDTILAVGRTRAGTGFEAGRLIGAVVTRPVALLLAASDGSTRYVVIDPWAAGLDGDGLGGNMRHPRSVAF